MITALLMMIKMMGLMCCCIGLDFFWMLFCTLSASPIEATRLFIWLSHYLMMTMMIHKRGWWYNIIIWWWWWGWGHSWANYTDANLASAAVKPRQTILTTCLFDSDHHHHRHDHHHHHHDYDDDSNGAGEDDGWEDDCNLELICLRVTVAVTMYGVTSSGENRDK